MPAHPAGDTDRAAGLEEPSAATDARPIKVIVWDLDHTLWDGVLLEDGDVTLRPGIVDTITALDRRGILHSVASRNDPDTALARLEKFQLAEYFLHPRIGWGAKSESVAAIAADLNLSLDAVAFVDDDAVERAEVAFHHPQVRCFHPDDAPSLPDLPELAGARTEEAARRRQLYREDLVRTRAEAEHEGPRPEFLASLNMNLLVHPARREDLERLRELTLRTNQLNSTGHTYNLAELEECLRSDRYELVVAELSDRFGSYGKIGLALTEHIGDRWLVKLVLTSCRVLNRGIGSILLTVIANRAVAAGARLQAEFVETGRNRPMYVAFRLAGFRPAAESAEPTADGRPVILERADTSPVPVPAHVTVDDRT
ncbi:HAD-IIIC family phosphatase [Streptomyces sioyaensis]|uniref:HAD-IIIC family phosphatase n=1 Tax=Streptomyces sioyaensis TaxID=67364 RepID=UPI0037B633D0